MHVQQLNCMDIASEARSASKESNRVSFGVQRNAVIFAAAMLFLQVGMSLVYGFLIRAQSVQFNAASVLVASGLAILVVAGFGLIFGYTRRLVWSGIGFTFFITALCIELYPLVNAFWTKTGLQTNNTQTSFSFQSKIYSLFLSDRETGSANAVTYYGNSITNGIKCALSVAVAFSSILGRAGHLQCLIVTVLGTVGFQLNRQIVQQNQGIDTFGTFYIFAFGGFMGLGLGLFSFIRERKVEHRIDRISRNRYNGSEYSSLYSALGVLIIFALFPLLAYEFDSYSRYQSHSPHANPVSILVAMGAGTLGSVFVSALINGNIIVRDALHGPIAGAIAVGASSLFIASPVYAFVAGAAGGISQALIQNLIEKRASRRGYIVSTVSWSLFGLQGLIGAGFASGWQAILYTSNNSMPITPSTLSFSSQFQFYGGLISAGIGAACGLVIGLFLMLINGHQTKEYFEDYYYWHSDDMISYEMQKKPKVQAPVTIPPQKVPSKVEETANVPYLPIQQPQVNFQPQPSRQLIEPPPVQANATIGHNDFDFSVDLPVSKNPYAYL